MSHYGILSYLSRSGSTFLSDKLNRYEDICVTLEASFPPELLGIQKYKLVQVSGSKDLHVFLSDLETISKVKNWRIDRDVILERLRKLPFPITGFQIFKTYLDCFKDKYKPKAKFIIYKGSPAMPWTIPQLLSYSEGLKILYLQRDPRAIYASQIRNKLPYTNTTFTDSPFQVALDWKRSVSALERCNCMDLYKLKYEDLIQGDGEIEGILSFLGVKNTLDETCFDYSQILPEEEKSIHIDVRKASKSTYVDKWRNLITKSEIAQIEWICEPYLEREQYDVSNNFDTNQIASEYEQYRRKKNWKEKLNTIKKIVGQPALYLRRLKFRK